MQIPDMYFQPGVCSKIKTALQYIEFFIKCWKIAVLLT